MSEVTREQFAAAVVAAVSSVQHLYRALDRLMLELREALAEPPHPLTAVPGMLGKSARDSAGRLVLRYEYGTLFRLATAEADLEGDDDADPDDDDEDDEDGAPARGRISPAIGAGECLLGLRVAMFDARQQASFEPHLAYAAMTDWRMGTQAPDVDQQLVLARHMLRRITRALANPDRKKGTLLTTTAQVKRVEGSKKGKGPDRRLACRVPMGIEIVPLYSLEEPASVFSLAEQMKEMWAAASRR